MKAHSDGFTKFWHEPVDEAILDGVFGELMRGHGEPAAASPPETGGPDESTLCVWWVTEGRDHRAVRQIPQLHYPEGFDPDRFEAWVNARHRGLVSRDWGSGRSSGRCLRVFDPALRLDGFQRLVYAHCLDEGLVSPGEVACFLALHPGGADFGN
jgi:hypothetical protein